MVEIVFPVEFYCVQPVARDILAWQNFHASADIAFHHLLSSLPVSSPQTGQNAL
jgi:hypothetical protein